MIGFTVKRPEPTPDPCPHCGGPTFLHPFKLALRCCWRHGAVKEAAR